MNIIIKNKNVHSMNRLESPSMLSPQGHCYCGTASPSHPHYSPWIPAILTHSLYLLFSPYLLILNQ